MHEKAGHLVENIPRGLANPIKNKSVKDANFAVKPHLADMFDFEAVQESLQ